MGDVIYPPQFQIQTLRLDGGGILRLDTRYRERAKIAWARALEYAKHKADCLYPDEKHRKMVEPKLARKHYMELMFP